MHQSKAEKIIDQVKASYSSIASEFNQTRKQPWKEFEHFLTYVHPGDRILDVGCGNGRLYETLEKKDIRYLGIDHNAELLIKARENYPEAHFEEGDMSHLDLKTAVFDKIFCIAAFHHLPDWKTRKRALSNLHDALKEEGILILTVWNLVQWKYIFPFLCSIIICFLTFGTKGSWNDLWIKWGKYPLKRYYHAFMPQELKRLFEAKKWRIEEFYFTKKGKRVSFFRSFNIVMIARKIKN